MANKTKLIQYTFTEKEDDGHNNKIHIGTKRAIFLDPKDSESGIGFLIIKSNWGNGPLTIYLVKQGKEVKSFFFGNDFGADGFPIPGHQNADPWNKIKTISSDNLLRDEDVEVLISNFNITKSYYDVKKTIWEIFGKEL